MAAVVNPFNQLLVHGRAICRNNFPAFVEAWNWLIGKFCKMQGDGNLDPTSGHIVRDDTLGFPVWRLINFDTTSGGGGDITVTGTDGSTATGSKLSFASADDSAVGVHVSKDAATGIITATISVHWKT